MMLRPVRITPPATLPVTLEEAKAHLRVEVQDDDTFITALIAAATDHLDGYSGILGRCIVNQQWRQGFASWSPLRLPFPNVSDVAVTYLDANGESQTAAAIDHRLIEAVRGPEVYFRPGWAAPVTDIGMHDPVQVTFTAGYGTAADVPASIKAAILLHIGTLYEHRESIVTGTIVAPTGAYDALISPHRWLRT